MPSPYSQLPSQTCSIIVDTSFSTSQPPNPSLQQIFSTLLLKYLLNIPIYPFQSLLHSAVRMSFVELKFEIKYLEQSFLLFIFAFTTNPKHQLTQCYPAQALLYPPALCLSLCLTHCPAHHPHLHPVHCIL